MPLRNDKEAEAVFYLRQLTDVTFAPPGPWVDDGRCTTTNPDLWFPKVGVSIEFNKAICNNCPVYDECLDYALSLPALRGIWAGTTMKERQALRQERAILESEDQQMLPASGM